MRLPMTNDFPKELSFVIHSDSTEQNVMAPHNSSLFLLSMSWCWFKSLLLESALVRGLKLTSGKLGNKKAIFDWTIGIFFSFFPKLTSKRVLMGQTDTLTILYKAHWYNKLFRKQLLRHMLSTSQKEYSISHELHVFEYNHSTFSIQYIVFHHQKVMDINLWVLGIWTTFVKLIHLSSNLC